MKLDIRRLLSFCDHREVEAGHRHALPLRRVASVAMVGNPYAGRYVEDLSEAIEASAEVGRVLSKLAVELMGPYDIESYGKGGVVGLNGELEHANAMLTTVFAAPLREAVGGAAAWIPSFTKLAAPGSASMCRSLTRTLSTSGRTMTGCRSRCRRTRPRPTRSR